MNNSSETNGVQKEVALKINPQITQDFVEDVLCKAERGTYRVSVAVGEQEIPIDVFPNVFPPKSDYSVSSRSVYEAFGDLAGMDVADIGSGTGIESIVAILAGAAHVDATDAYQDAANCTKHNVRLNGLEQKVSVYAGDLFSSLPQKNMT